MKALAANAPSSAASAAGVAAGRRPARRRVRQRSARVQRGEPAHPEAERAAAGWPRAWRRSAAGSSAPCPPLTARLPQPGVGRHAGVGQLAAGRPARPRPGSRAPATAARASTTRSIQAARRGSATSGSRTQPADRVVRAENARTVSAIEACEATIDHSARAVGAVAGDKAVTRTSLARRASRRPGTRHRPGRQKVLGRPSRAGRRSASRSIGPAGPAARCTRPSTARSRRRRPRPGPARAGGSRAPPGQRVRRQQRAQRPGRDSTACCAPAELAAERPVDRRGGRVQHRTAGSPGRRSRPSSAVIRPCRRRGRAPPAPP